MRNTQFVALAMLAACATGSSEGPAVTTRTATAVAPQQSIDLTHENVINTVDFAAPRARVWQAMMSAHEALGFPVVGSDEKAGAARFQFESKAGSLLGKPTSNFIDCGMGSAGPRVNTYRVTIKVTEAVESAYVDRTRLLILVEATARSPSMNADPMQCTSLGTLEKLIVGMVAARL